jgi:diguanylate cyclase (GGDEF)-like protein
MLAALLHRFGIHLHRTLEGELAGMPPHERREQHRRQIRMLHGPLSNLLLALALLEALRVSVHAFADWAEAASLGWEAAAAAGMLALAGAYRNIVSLRRRVLLGFAFLAVLLLSLSGLGSEWRQMPVLSLAGFLLIPVATLPLLVRPRVALAVLAACTVVAAALLFALDEVSPQERLLFAFYYLMSATAGLTLRRARANLAIRLDQKVENLWQRAVSDPLTGLLNRQGWMSLAGAAMDEAAQQGHRPVVLFIDVDYFKRVNDAHGHLAGDEILRELGHLLASRVGPGELCARLGGEEFACLLPQTTDDQAERFAMRLANDYRELAERFGSTLSIGIAVHREGDLLNDMLARADAALYQAKRAGRDRIVYARED